MKKIALSIAMLCAAISAHADQCPPSSALSHAKAGQHWQLAKEYQKQGWYVALYPYADLSNFANIPAPHYTTVKFVSNEDDNLAQWFVTCNYNIDDSAFPRYVVVTKNELLPFNPERQTVANFYPSDPGQKSQSSYYCGTQDGSSVQCNW